MCSTWFSCIMLTFEFLTNDKKEISFWTAFLWTLQKYIKQKVCLMYPPLSAINSASRGHPKIWSPLENFVRIYKLLYTVVFPSEIILCSIICLKNSFLNKQYILCIFQIGTYTVIYLKKIPAYVLIAWVCHNWSSLYPVNGYVGYFNF